MTPTLKYLWLTLKHKAFVFRAGLKTRAPLWRLVIHDWSKFTLAEAPHYGRQFFGAKDDPQGFARAWLHHQNCNPHHWEYWIPRTGHGRGDDDLVSLPMPEWAVREMVADWLGASRAYGGTWPNGVIHWKWFCDNWYSISRRMDRLTIMRVEMVMREMFPAPRWTCLACQDDDCAKHGSSIAGAICYEIACPVCERVGRKLAA